MVLNRSCFGTDCTRSVGIIVLDRSWSGTACTKFVGIIVLGMSCFGTAFTRFVCIMVPNMFPGLAVPVPDLLGMIVLDRPWSGTACKICWYSGSEQVLVWYCLYQICWFKFLD